MPLFDYNPERAKKKQAETLGSMKGAWEAVKGALSSPEGLKQAALGVAKMGTFPFSALGQRDWGNQGLMDVMDNPAAGASQAVSPWMLMKREAEAFKHTRMPHDFLQKLYDWQSTGTQSARTDLGEILEHMPEEVRRAKLHKLTAKAKTRRNPETGEPEFLLYRGIGSTEKAMTERAKKTVPDYTSFTPWPHVARTFAVPAAIESWIPESRIAGVPKEFGRYFDRFDHPNTKGQGKNQYSSEYEVIVKPETKIDVVKDGGKEFLDSLKQTTDTDFWKSKGGYYKKLAEQNKYAAEIKALEEESKAAVKSLWEKAYQQAADAQNATASPELLELKKQHGLK